MKDGTYSNVITMLIKIETYSCPSCSFSKKWRKQPTIV